jgi:hypothetical protein
MNVEIGPEAPQFLEKEYINGIFLAVQLFFVKMFHVPCLPDLKGLWKGG